MEELSLLDLAKGGEIATTGQRPKLPTSIPNVNATMLEVYKIPLKYLYYNDENGRISSALRNKITPARDDENPSYNEFFENAIVSDNAAKLKRTKKSIAGKGQEVFGYVLQDGRVIDGNRRYTALRQIARETGQSQFFEAVILPITYDSKASRTEIKRLELAIQHGQEEKLSYDPLDWAVDIYETVEVNELLTAEDYAHEADEKLSDVKNRIEAIKMVRDFLKYINADDDNYQLIKDAKIFSAIEDTTKRFVKQYPNGGPKAERAKVLLFNFMLTRIYAASGDVLKENRKFMDTVVKSGQQDVFGEDSEDAVEHIQDVLDQEKTISIGGLQKRLDSTTSDIRNFTQAYNTLNQRQSRGKNVDSFIDSVNSQITTLKDLIKEDGMSGQLTYDNFSRDQIRDLRDAMIQIKSLSQELSEIYENEL